MPPFRLQLESVGKQFYRRWLFQGLSLELGAGERLALVGNNGSGKSTLLRIIAGQMAPTAGRVTFLHQGQRVPANLMYQHLSWSAPYIELFPELTLREQLRLQQRLTPFVLSEAAMLEALELQEEADKPLRYYSSGMLQRAKVGLALFAQADLLLLDEPTSNMDQHNAALILNLLDQYQGERAVVLASNLAREFGEFQRQIHLGGTYAAPQS